MLGWCSLAADRISRRKRSRTPGRLDQVAADDLEHLFAAHQRVLGEVDHAHPATAQLAEDPVVGVVRQSRRQGAGRGRGREARATVHHRHADERGARVTGGLGPTLDVADLAQERVGGHRGDPASAVGAGLEMFIDRFGRCVVQLSQPVGVQRLVGRMKGRLGDHEVGLRLRVRDDADGSMAHTIKKGRFREGPAAKMRNSFEKSPKSSLDDRMPAVIPFQTRGSNDLGNSDLQPMIFSRLANLTAKLRWRIIGMEPPRTPRTPRSPEEPFRSMILLRVFLASLAVQ